MKDMKKERLAFLFENCLEYITELKKREDKDERIDFFKNIIGMTDEEINDLYIE